VQANHRKGTQRQAAVANRKGGDIIRPDICSKELIRVPRGHVWIQGDNLSNSIDSRNYGAVPEATLKGRVLGRVVILFLRSAH